MRIWTKLMNLQVFKLLRLEKNTAIRSVQPDGSDAIFFPGVMCKNGMTAHAGGTQAGAIADAGAQVNAVLNRVTTVGTAADSVVLPQAQQGLEITVSNAAAANSMNVFPNTGDAINALAANAAFAVAANKTATFVCTNTGQWHAILTA
jgi:hypothetical protein